MNEFDVILDECVDLIASGETSLEECLRRYPEYAAQLEPILYTTVRLKEAREITPPPFLRVRIRTELNQRIKDSRPKHRVSVFFLRMTFGVAVFLITLTMANTVFAQNALPGEVLYDWKLASENLWRAVAVDPLEADLKLSDRRINEYKVVTDEERRAQILLGYNKLLVRFQDEKDENDRARIQSVLKSQQDSLRTVGLSIPELDRYFSGDIPGTGSDFQIEMPDTPSSRPTP